MVLASLIPSAASAAVIGPDSFGYIGIDQADGTVYNYVDITGTGVIVASGAEVTAAVTMGAPFSVYGTMVTDMVVNTNGFLTDDLGSAFDASNDCPLPDPPSTGVGFRIYVLHDDLNVDVYYQYFDEAGAAALGFPGETAGISVFQWVGAHDFGAGPVDVEAILFHDDNSFLTMVAADPEEGSGSTIGIQNDGASIGLTYQCNTAMAVVPGTTAIQWNLGAAPDSDCCTASPTGTPGCMNAACQSFVCDNTASCCSTDWDVSCADDAVANCLVLCGGMPQISINEVRIDQPGTDDDEFIEIVGPPGTPLTDVQYIAIGDFPSGELESVTDLTGGIIPPSGIFVAAESTFTIGVADFTTTFNLENTDTVTHMLIGGLSEPVGFNLDNDQDGVLDVTPWSTTFDTVAIIHPPSADFPYGPGSSCMAGPFCQEVNDMVAAPQQIYRCGDVSGDWQIGNIDPAAMPLTDSPGALNCCGDGVVDAPEECDDAGESATCDADCTMVVCGDGIINMTAGEECEEGGVESATCDVDCTAPVCGDGIVNMTAGEACDGDGMGTGGETDTCNDDCTPAMCGDGIVNAAAGEVCDDAGRSQMCNDDCTETTCGDGVLNMTAGEECDDGGESAACDDDCSVAECGDGTVNMTAGEECDDGNTDDGDGCDASCLDEGAGSGDSTGGDPTGGAVDSTGGSGGGTAGGTGGPSTVTATSGPGSSGGETDTDTDSGGATPVDEGCNCSNSTEGQGRGAAWSILALLGLAGLRRRRRD